MKLFKSARATVLLLGAYMFFGAEPLQAHVNIIVSDAAGVWMVAESQYHTQSYMQRIWSTALTPIGNVPLQFASPGAPCTLVTCTATGSSVIRLRINWSSGSQHGEDLRAVTCGESGGYR